MTVDEVVKLVDEAAAGVELLAPELGLAEIAPLVQSVRQLFGAVMAVAEGKRSAELTAEVAAADTAADVAEDAKFGVK